MPTPENKVKAFVDKWIKKWYPGAFKYSPPGVGRFGKNGMPDRIWFIRVIDDFGITVAIEAKAIGNVLSDLQYRTLHLLTERGVVAASITGQDMDKLLKIKAEIDRRILILKMLEDIQYD